jgi:hypothetical protein
MNTMEGSLVVKSAGRSASDRIGSYILSEFGKLTVHLHKTNHLLNPQIRQ